MRARKAFICRRERIKSQMTAWGRKTQNICLFTSRNVKAFKYSLYYLKDVSTPLRWKMDWTAVLYITTGHYHSTDTGGLSFGIKSRTYTVFLLHPIEQRVWMKVNIDGDETIIIGWQRKMSGSKNRRCVIYMQRKPGDNKKKMWKTLIKPHWDLCVFCISRTCWSTEAATNFLSDIT